MYVLLKLYLQTDAIYIYNLSIHTKQKGRAVSGDSTGSLYGTVSLWATSWTCQTLVTETWQLQFLSVRVSSEDGLGPLDKQRNAINN